MATLEPVLVIMIRLAVPELLPVVVVKPVTLRAKVDVAVKVVAVLLNDTSTVWLAVTLTN